jgi:hypothetical protein
MVAWRLSRLTAPLLSIKRRLTSCTQSSGVGTVSACLASSVRATRASMAQIHACADVRSTISGALSSYARAIVSSNSALSRTGKTIAVFDRKKTPKRYLQVDSEGSGLARSSRTFESRYLHCLCPGGLSKMSKFSRNVLSPVPSEIHCRPRDEKRPTPLKYQLLPRWQRESL